MQELDHRFEASGVARANAPSHNVQSYTPVQPGSRSYPVNVGVAGIAIVMYFVS